MTVGLRPLFLELLEDAIDFQDEMRYKASSSTASVCSASSGKTFISFGPRVGFALAAANDLQGLLEPFEDDRETFENVNPPLELPQLVLEPPRDRFKAEVEEVPQQVLEADPCRDEGPVFVGDKARRVDGEILLEGRVA